MRLVMDVLMGMRLHTVNMLVLVSFGHMKPHAQRHEGPCQDQLDRHGVVQNDERDYSAQKRSRGK